MSFADFDKCVQLQQGFEKLKTKAFIFVNPPNKFKCNKSTEFLRKEYLIEGNTRAVYHAMEVTGLSEEDKTKLLTDPRVNSIVYSNYYDEEPEFIFRSPLESRRQTLIIGKDAFLSYALEDVLKVDTDYELEYISRLNGREEIVLYKATMSKECADYIATSRRIKSVVFDFHDDDLNFL